MEIASIVCTVAALFVAYAWLQDLKANVQAIRANQLQTAEVLKQLMDSSTLSHEIELEIATQIQVLRSEVPVRLRAMADRIEAAASSDPGAFHADNEP